MSEPHQRISEVFSLVDREIWVVTSAAEGRRGGLVATWVSQASLDSSDPLAVIALAINHYTTELVNQSRAFGLHLLSPEQKDVAWQFGLGSGRDRDKLAGLESTTHNTGAPILANCLAWLECQVIHQYDAADRTLYWGQVVAGEVLSRASPLREQQLFASASPEQAQALKTNMADDIRVQRPLIAAWKAASAG